MSKASQLIKRINSINESISRDELRQSSKDENFVTSEIEKYLKSSSIGLEGKLKDLSEGPSSVAKDIPEFVKFLKKTYSEYSSNFCYIDAPSSLNHVIYQLALLDAKSNKYVLIPSKGMFYKAFVAIIAL